MNQKADIFIKIGNYTKGISLKCGNNNSIHQEPIQEFKLLKKQEYLIKQLITIQVINMIITEKMKKQTKIFL